MYTKCPMCDGSLLKAEKSFSDRMVRDGNSVYECDKNKSHRFWCHPFRHNLLKWHPNTSVSGGQWHKAFEYEDGKIVKIHVNTESIGQ